MIFVDSIYDLWYYRKKAEEPCYCEHLVYPNDILLQSTLSTGYTSGFSVQVFVYSPDGLTQYEDATAYFSFYVGVNPSGVKFFNLRCEEFSPAMCAYKCYILKVVVTVSGSEGFNKYTEQYCQTSCCDIPRGISIDPEGVEPTIVEESQPVPFGSCGVPLLRIRSIFECIDNETGLYYGIPESVLTGTANFSYEKITNYSGKIRRQPREITRLTSFNCNLQRSESFKPYLLTGNSIDGILPEWKLNELENMLHASFIEVDDFGVRYGKKQYQFAGGTIGERILACFDTFRINITLQDCTVRTDFGCGDCGTITAKEYLISANATGELFYNENKQPVGDFEGLLDYFTNLGFTVTDTSGDYDNTYGSFTAQGIGLLPSFYYDYLYQKNKVYGTTTPVAPQIACAQFSLGIVYSEDTTCPDFVQGVVYSEDTAVTSTDIMDIGNWTATGTSTLTETTGKLSFSSVNVAKTVEEVFAGEEIGIIDYPGRPSVPQAIDFEDGTQLTIDTDGIIRYYGYPTTVDGGGTTITITDRYYSL